MNLTSYKAWIFDFDYTLADATRGIVTAYNRAFCEFGFPEQPEAVIRSTVGLTVPESFMIMTGSKDEELARRFFERFVRIADEVMTANTEYLPGARELLLLLRTAGKPRAVVTTKMAYRITDFFEKRGEPELLDFVIGYEDVVQKKPSPDIYLSTARKLQRPPQSCIVIEDALNGVKAAKAAGMKCIGIATSFGSGQLYEAGADIVCNDISDVYGALMKISGQS